MFNQSAKLALSEIPSKWQERFILKRIGEEDMEISLATRDGILKALQRGDRFVQIGKFTIMVNSIKSIEPKWGEKNIPPRPMPFRKYVIAGTAMKEVVENKDEIDEWDKVFGE